MLGQSDARHKGMTGGPSGDFLIQRASRAGQTVGMMKTDRLTAPLLACGLLSSLLYLVADVFAALRFPGYNYAS